MFQIQCKQKQSNEYGTYARILQDKKKKGRNQRRKERERGRITCKRKTKYTFWKKTAPGTEENIR